MKRGEKPSLLVFDFDGVLTDNRVLVMEDGGEGVWCDRSDGLAFDMLRAARIPCLLLSTERNRVVSARARKLKIPVIQGAKSKVTLLRSYCVKHKIDLKKVLYVGNDINDLEAMRIVGVSACPADAHIAIKRISKIKLRHKGGRGVVRELVENWLGLSYRVR